MGENGAGKSTLMKILSGADQPDAGAETLIEGRAVAIGDPNGAKKAGIAIIYQERALAPNLSGRREYLPRPGNPQRRPRRRPQGDGEGLQGGAGAARRAVQPQDIVGTLSIAEQQLVEIARALHAKSRILVLDEPTTALSARETERLFALVRQLRKEGIARIDISHRMAEIYELSDRVSVLRDGSYVGTLDREGLSVKSLVKMMVGRDPSTFYKKEPKKPARDGTRGEVLFQAIGLIDGGKRAKPCSFEMRRGEVLGIAGLVGSGRTELAGLIFGADPKKDGAIELEGKRVEINSPQDGIDHGIA